MTSGLARAWHLLTAVVAGGAVLFQLVLVINGSATLLPGDDPGLAVRLAQFISYFTILCNLLVVVSVAPLARNARRDGELWRVLRLSGIVGIAVTGLVHWFLLRPLLDLEGGDYLADKLLHVVVPILAVIGWLAFGPRGRATVRELPASLVFPVGWLVLTLVRGSVTGWYPYPFLDVGDLGYGRTLLNCLGVAVLFTGVSFGAIALDARLARRRTPG